MSSSTAGPEDTLKNGNPRLWKMGIVTQSVILDWRAICEVFSIKNTCVCHVGQRKCARTWGVFGLHVFDTFSFFTWIIWNFLVAIYCELWFFGGCLKKHRHAVVKIIKSLILFMNLSIIFYYIHFLSKYKTKHLLLCYQKMYLWRKCDDLTSWPLTISITSETKPEENMRKELLHQQQGSLW